MCLSRAALGEDSFEELDPIKTEVNRQKHSNSQTFVREAKNQTSIYSANLRQRCTDRKAASFYRF